MVITVDDCQGIIFQLYIVQGKTLDQVRDTLRRQKGLNTSRKVLNTKISAWGYTKKYKRSEHLAVFREQTSRVAEGKLSSFTRKGRPVDLQKVESYIRRERLHSNRPSPFWKPNLALSGDLICRTPPPQLPRGPPFILCWRAPEKFLHDVSVLVKSSFETGCWAFNGNDQLINCGPTLVHDLTTLNAFLGDMRIGCAAAHERSLIVAGSHWRRAFLALETLVNGCYFNILPNLIQTINDLNFQNFTYLARQLKHHIASLSVIKAQETSVSAALSNLAQVDMSVIGDLEQRVMRLYTQHFEQYLGQICYNSFVMTMDTARRELLQDSRSALEDHLPLISDLDTVFGPCDRRPLDTISVRLEILHRRGKYDQVEAEALSLVSRAQLIVGDEWQRLYHLTRGWYYLGHAQYLLRKHDLALDSLAAALRCKEELSWRNDFSIFKAEKVIIQRCLNDR